MEVKSNIGDVSKGIDKATTSTKKLADETKEVGGATTTAKKGFKGLGTAVKGVGIALKAAGIGLIIAIFASLKEAVERNQTAMDGLNNVMTTISTTFNQVVTVLTDVVDWVTQSEERFDGLGKVLTGIVTLSLTPMKLSFFGLKLGIQQLMLAWEDSFLGGGDAGKIKTLRADILNTKNDLEAVGTAALKAGKDIGDNLGDAIGEIGAIYEVASDGISKISVKGNFEQAKATTAATKAAMFAQEEFAKLNAEKLREAELLRQIRDDETKTYAERIQANTELKKSLEEQQVLQTEQIQKQITAAQLLVDQNGNDENKLALMQAQNAQLELEETITGQLSEQKTNQVGLEKELLETQNQLRAEGLSGIERELEELKTAYELKVEMARKAGVDTKAITTQYEKDVTDVKKTESDKQISIEKAKKDMQFDMANQGLQILSDAAGEGTAIAKAAAIAQATISGVQGVQNAFTAANANIGATAGTFGVYPVTMAALAGTFAAMNIAKIASGGAPAPPSTTTPPTTSIPAPQMMSGAFDISGGVAPEPVQAFVLTDSMTNSQNQLANIRRRATI